MTTSFEAGRSKLLFFGCIALALGTAQFVADRDRRPLDDRDLAFQRPGFLDAHGPPFLAPDLQPGIRRPRERAVVFFVRSEQAGPLHDALLERAHPFDEVAMAVVYAGKGLDHRDLVAPFIPDDYGHIAAGFRMPWPRDGGPPVGYAVVDSHGMVRYRTLDPTVWKRLKEVETIWAATP